MILSSCVVEQQRRTFFGQTVRLKKADVLKEKSGGDVFPLLSRGERTTTVSSSLFLRSILMCIFLRVLCTQKRASRHQPETSFISLFNSMTMISHVCILSSFSLRDAKRIKEQFSSSKEEENNKLSSTLVVFKRTPRIWY